MFPVLQSIWSFQPFDLIFRPNHAHMSIDECVYGVFRPSQVTNVCDIYVCGTDSVVRVDNTWLYSSGPVARGVYALELTWRMFQTSKSFLVESNPLRSRLTVQPGTHKFQTLLLTRLGLAVLTFTLWERLCQQRSGNL